MNAGIDQKGLIYVKPSLSKQGDHIDLRAEMDILCAISACPSTGVCNNGIPKPVGVELLSTDAEAAADRGVLADRAGRGRQVSKVNNRTGFSAPTSCASQGWGQDKWRIDALFGLISETFALVDIRHQLHTPADG